MSAGAAALHTTPFGFNPGDARDRSLIGGVLTTPQFVGPFCRSVGAQFTAQSWHTDPLCACSSAKWRPTRWWARGQTSFRCVGQGKQSLWRPDPFSSFRPSLGLRTSTVDAHNHHLAVRPWSNLILCFYPCFILEWAQRVPRPLLETHLNRSSWK